MRLGAISRLAIRAVAAAVAMAVVLASPARAALVRTSFHPDFARLAFELPEGVTYESRIEGRILQLGFSQPPGIDLQLIAARLPDHVTRAVASPDPSAIEIELARGATAQPFSQGPRTFGFDIVLEDSGQKVVDVRGGRHDGFNRLAIEFDRPARYEILRREDVVSIDFGRPGPRIPPGIARWVAPLIATIERSESGLRLHLAPGARLRHFSAEDGRVVALDVIASPSQAEAVAGRDEDRPATGTDPGGADVRPSDPSPAAGSPADVAAGAPESVGEADRPSPVPEPAPALIFEVSGETDEVALRFDWPAPVGAAVFMRSGQLWVAFDARVPFGWSAPTLEESTAPTLGPPRVVRLANGTVLIFPLRERAAPAVGRDGDAWILTLARPQPDPTPPEPAWARAADRLMIEGAEAVLEVTDPAVGERLIVLPLREPGRAVPVKLRLVDLVLPQTAQGVVLERRADGVEVAPVEKGIEIGRAGGLRLSPLAESRPGGGDKVDAAPVGRPDPAVDVQSDATPVGDRGADREAGGESPPPAPSGSDDDPDEAEPQTSPQATGQRPADVVEVEGPPPRGGYIGLAQLARAADFATLARARQRDLQTAIARSDGERRDRHRIELARLLLARGLAAEALAVLDAVGDSPAGKPVPPDIDHARQALGAAASVLLGRLDEARVRLDAVALDDDPEVALFRAALAAAAHDWREAGAALARSDDVLERYPRAIQARLGPAAVRAAIEAGQPERAYAWLEALQARGLLPGVRAVLGYLKGLALARDGATAEAERVWRGVAESRHTDARLRARHDLARLLLEEGLMEPAAAIAVLEEDRSHWRDRPGEAEALQTLGDLYRQVGNAEAALAAWKAAVVRTRAPERAASVLDEMRSLFAHVMSRDEGDSADAVRALVIYETYPELVPSGRAGQLLVRKLALRVADAGLPDRADTLVETALLPGLEGAAKADAGALMAGFRLERQDPEGALSALETTRTPARLNPALEDRRRHLEAEALIVLGRHGEALDLIADDDRPRATALRLEAAWRGGRWREAAAAAQTLLEARSDPEAALTPAEQGIVVKRALALAHLDDSAALAALQDTYGSAVTAVRSLAVTAGAASGPETPAEMLEQVRDETDAARTLLGTAGVPLP